MPEFPEKRPFPIDPDLIARLKKRGIHVLKNSLIPLVEVPETLTIELETSQVAAWTPISNSFTKVGADPPGDPYDWKWNGFFIQMGQYEQFGEADRFVDALHQIEFKTDPDTNIVPVPKSAFDGKDEFLWINVVAREEGSPLPDPVAVDLENPASFIEVMKRVRMLPDPDLDAPPWTTPAGLYHHFRAYKGGITLWQDREDGCVIRSGAETAGGLNRFRFTVKRTSALKLHVFFGTNLQTEPQVDVLDLSQSNVVKIFLRVDPGGDNGLHKDPPQGGG